jgi:preprotein translocase subunit SecD
MKFCLQRLNLYLWVVLAVGLCGCKSTPESQTKKLVATLRLHIEAGRDSSKSSEPVPVYREQPVMINVEKEPFLSEGSVNQATVFNAVGGFALRVQFDHQGSTLLEQYTSLHRGKRIAIFSQFGDKIQDYRWLAAPVISHRISDGVLVFTPDTTREEAEEIAIGLNNVSAKTHTWIDKD